MFVPYLKGGTLFVIVLRIISFSKRRTMNLLGYIALIINYLKKRRVVGL